ncbi:hypothetical protein TRFO_09669 [Tritrichomonas foetus]|uniref:Fluoroacetyl-CoA-specific thioesterase-like domain-containing protein n=1 Tax=Tritrichomonas foetus TaxID=1144522 RepID=A0A1J4JD33_9EUKA|nr:hypothetical protein TRFO_09669 [Tritrichomonas foetus]|eukprot:OHS97102.1 hypothetical protein TRFO_09669 [Tritrichomonas foetus]
MNDVAKSENNFKNVIILNFRIFFYRFRTRMQDSIGKAIMKVSNRDLAPVMKTGIVNVLSTAKLSALMEQASCSALETACFISGQTSVAATMKLHHRRPSPIGANVTAIARVTDIDKDGIHFEIEAFDESGLIGTALHTRVFVNKDLFERKCYDSARLAQLIE